MQTLQDFVTVLKALFSITNICAGVLMGFGVLGFGTLLYWWEKRRVIKKSKGGSVSSASKRADGCAIRGKTKGRMV